MHGRISFNQGWYLRQSSKTIQISSRDLKHFLLEISGNNQHMTIMGLVGHKLKEALVETKAPGNPFPFAGIIRIRFNGYVLRFSQTTPEELPVIQQGSFGMVVRKQNF